MPVPDDSEATRSDPDPGRDPSSTSSDPAGDETIEFDISAPPSSTGSGRPTGQVSKSLPSNMFPGYRILDAIHRGGQGVLYRAIQKTTKRMVAIKVLKEGPFASEGEQARFEREIEILAQLKHPGLVAIHDTGVVAGVHYFVMDYIEGSRLDEHPRATAGVRDALKLFAEICEVVNAAHLRGVIHRDLKPGNIRVDPEGRPHVLDFGLAKTMGEDSEALSMTRTGQFMGSLPWASPEQAEAVPERIDMRTDVYSLGMILYHLLTDRFPFEHHGSVREVLDRIVVSEPVAPRTIRQEIDDEVQTIILKCLNKDPERRYQSAGELGRDVRRYLNGEPIEAKRDSFGYVLRKTISRHRIPVAVTAGVLLLLGISLIATSVLYVGAERAKLQAVEATEVAVEAERRAEAALEAEANQRQLAESETAEALAVTDFLVEVLGLADPEVTLTPGVTLLDMLEIASGRVGGAFTDQPEAEATVRTAIGQAYASLGELRQADLHLRRALEIRESMAPDDAAALYATLRPLMKVSLSLGAADVGAMWVKGWKSCLKTLAAAHPELEEPISALPEARTDEMADSLRVEVIELAERTLLPGDPEWLLVADQLHLLGMGSALYGQPRAEGYLRDALRIRRRELPETHPSIASVLTDLVRVYRRSGETEEALALVEESIDIRRRTLPEGHWLIAMSRSQLGACLADLSRYEEAESLLVANNRTISKAAGTRSITTANSLRRLVGLYDRWGRPDQAETYRLEFFTVYAFLEFVERWKTLRPMFGPERARVVALMDRLDQLDEEEGGGQLSVAERNDELVAILDALLPECERLRVSAEPVAVVLARYLTYAADRWYPAWAAREHSERMARAAMSVLEPWGEVIPGDVAYVTSELAWHAVETKDFNRAVDLSRKAWAITRAGYGERSLQAALAQRMVGITLARRGDYAEAESLLAGSYPRLREDMGPGADVARQVLNELLTLYDEWGQPGRARPYLVDASLAVLPRWVLVRPFLSSDYPDLVEPLDALEATLTAEVEPADSLVATVLAEGREAFAPEDSAALVYAQVIHTWSVQCGETGCSTTPWLPFKEEALEIRRRLAGPDHMATLNSMNTVAWALRDTDRLEEAEALALEALAGLEACCGRTGRLALATLDTWAVILQRQGRLDESLLAFEDLLDRDRRSLTQDDAAVLEHRIHYGQCLTEASRFEEAERVLLEVADACERAQGTLPRLSWETEASLGELYRRWGRPEAALTPLLKATSF